MKTDLFNYDSDSSESVISVTNNIITISNSSDDNKNSQVGSSVLNTSEIESPTKQGIIYK